MKWVLISSQQSLLQEYHLVENGHCRVIIKYNPVHRSARMSCEGNHRLFFIESAGSLSGKYIFKNEYDMETGHMNYDRWSGSVTIESKSYRYEIENNPLAEIVIFDSSSGQALVNCELSNNNNDAAIPLSRQNSSVENHFLLLGLCWYLFLPVLKENMVEYAA